eukprot:COSAG02_NODE_13493_length_1387_cov_1.340062_1_plen_308_part_00
MGVIIKAPARSVTALLLLSHLYCSGSASESIDNGAVQSSPSPQRVVGITPTGGFTVNGEAFFPMGFYYLFEAIGGDNLAKGGHPPRTDNTTNASSWHTADDFWQDYYRTGFNTFTIGWEGSTREEGYGQMLDYLQQDLQTGILPSKCTYPAVLRHACAQRHPAGLLVRRSTETGMLRSSWCCVAYAPCCATVSLPPTVLNVGNTQEVYNAKPKGDPQAKANVAGAMARNFANSSILAYYIFDEVGKNSLALDKTVTSAVTGNDTNHPTFSLVCGVQCSGWFDGLNALHYSEQHQLVAVDSCKFLHTP